MNTLFTAYRHTIDPIADELTKAGCTITPAAPRPVYQHSMIHGWETNPVTGRDEPRDATGSVVYPTAFRPLYVVVTPIGDTETAARVEALSTADHNGAELEYPLFDLAAMISYYTTVHPTTPAETAATDLIRQLTGTSDNDYRDRTIMISAVALIDEMAVLNLLREALGDIGEQAYTIPGSRLRETITTVVAMLGAARLAAV